MRGEHRAATRVFQARWLALGAQNTANNHRLGKVRAPSECVDAALEASSVTNTLEGRRAVTRTHVPLDTTAGGRLRGLSFRKQRRQVCERLARGGDAERSQCLGKQRWGHEESDLCKPRPKALSILSASSLNLQEGRLSRAGAKATSLSPVPNHFHKQHS